MLAARCAQGALGLREREGQRKKEPVRGAVGLQTVRTGRCRYSPIAQEEREDEGDAQQAGWATFGDGQDVDGLRERSVVVWMLFGLLNDGLGTRGTNWLWNLQTNEERETIERERWTGRQDTDEATAGRGLTC